MIEINLKAFIRDDTHLTSIFRNDQKKPINNKNHCT